MLDNVQINKYLKFRRNNNVKNIFKNYFYVLRSKGICNLIDLYNKDKLTICINKFDMAFKNEMKNANASVDPLVNLSISVMQHRLMDANLDLHVSNAFALRSLAFFKQNQLANSVCQFVNLAFKATEIIVCHNPWPGVM